MDQDVLLYAIRKFLRKFQLYEPPTVPILNHQITRPTPSRIELPLESPQEAVPPLSDTHPVPQDTPEPLADESIAEPASPPHDIVSEEKSTSAPPTLPIPDVKNIPSPAHVIQPESPKLCENRRSKEEDRPSCSVRSGNLGICLSCIRTTSYIYLDTVFCSLPVVFTICDVELLTLSISM